MRTIISRRGVFIWAFLALVILAGALTTTAAAQGTTPAAEDRLAKLEKDVAQAQSSGDNAWMLISSALVLMMTGPGLALFYGGLVRKKNVLATMMQSFALMAIVTVLWAIFGYSLCFASGNSFIGGFEHLFLRGVGAAPDADYAATIPAADLHGLPADVRHHHPGADHRRLCRAHEVQRHGAVHGAVVAHRLRPHGAHGVGQGRPAERQPGRAHSRRWISPAARWCTSPPAFRRWSARCIWASAWAIPRNRCRRTAWCSASSAPACCGWDGSASTPAARWPPAAWPPAHSWPRISPPLPRRWAGRLAEWLRNGKPSVLGAISGAVAGLVAITPASGFVGPMPALVIGFVAGVFCYLMVAKVKAAFGYDDSLDAFGVHGAGGTIGALADRRLRRQRGQSHLQRQRRQSARRSGLIDGNAHQVLNQLVGVVIAWVPGDRWDAGHPEGGRPRASGCACRRSRKSRAWISRSTARKATTWSTERKYQVPSTKYQTDRKLFTWYLQLGTWYCFKNEVS